LSVAHAVESGRVNQVCQCSALLDSRLMIVLVVWSTLLSIIVFIIIILVIVDLTPSQFVRVPSLPVFRHSRLDTESTSDHRTDDQTLDKFGHQQSAVVRRESIDSHQSDSWLQYLRDENWILYRPATATVISHQGSSSANQRSIRELRAT